MYEDLIEFEVPCLRVTQPLGDFYIASIPADRLVDITFFDVRRMLKERDVELYLGIQRPLVAKRVQEIRKYVHTTDACFPTAIIIAIEARCAEFDDAAKVLRVRNYPAEDSQQVLYRNIARVIDGQHRLAGLEDFEGEFELNVSVFIDADISDQANIFSTVNLAQTKVNRSLVYDLYDLANKRSPQKTCHNIVVALDRTKGSPFYRRIKRLGIATPNRTGETLTQATVVKPILEMISEDPMIDRDLYLRNRKPELLERRALRLCPWQNLFIKEMDVEITDIIWNYFSAVQQKWPEAWASLEPGRMLNRTNGYRGLMRFLGHLYKNDLVPLNEVIITERFEEIFASINIADEEFDTRNFAPGSAGESKLFRSLVAGELEEEPE